MGCITECASSCDIHFTVLCCPRSDVEHPPRGGKHARWNQRMDTQDCDYSAPVSENGS